MNTVLTIDTSTAHCAVALLHDSQLSEQRSVEQRQSAQRILPMISELLSAAGITLADLDFITVVAGPGSFTGVRIGIAVAQGLALSASLPVVALSSLALTAMACMRDSGCDRVLVSEQARDGELYFAAYRRCSERGVELIGREQVANSAELDALPEALRSESWQLAGDGWGEKSAILERLACPRVEQPTRAAIGNELIAELGLLRFQSGEAVAAAQLRPNYVKEQLDYT